MTARAASLLGAALAAVLAVSSAAAQEPGLEALQSALGAAGQLTREFHLQPKPAAAPVSSAAQAQQPFTVLGTGQWDSFSQPDANTLRWLALRVPGLDVSAVRQVPLEVAEEAMRRAAAAKVTYVDVLSDSVFRKNEIYFVGQDVLDALDARYISGTVPIRGKMDGGQPFQMQGLLVGQSRVEMLFDYTDFTFRDGGHRYKVSNGGRVEARVLGEGDIATSGISVYGVRIICPWARIDRITKDAAYSVKVQTSCGTRSNPIDPVRLR